MSIISVITLGVIFGTRSVAESPKTVQRVGSTGTENGKPDSDLVKVGIHGFYMKIPPEWKIREVEDVKAEHNNSNSDSEYGMEEEENISRAEEHDISLGYIKKYDKFFPRISIRTFEAKGKKELSGDERVDGIIQSFKKESPEFTVLRKDTYKIDQTLFQGGGVKEFSRSRASGTSSYHHAVILFKSNKDAADSVMIISGLGEKEDHKAIDAAIRKILPSLRLRIPKE